MRPLFILLLLLLGAGSWATLRYYRQQSHLRQQLAQLTTVLTVENDHVAQHAQGIIKSIEAAAAKNRNQPADLALLHRAERLQTCSQQLVATLRAGGEQLRRTAGNDESRLLRTFSAPSTRGLGQGTAYYHALDHQLATYLDSLSRLSPATAQAAALRMPAFEGATSAAETIADLCQLESHVLAHQTAALKRLAQSVGAQRWRTHLLLTTAAASDVVAPGDTYRAKLGVISYFSANELRMRMTCNGQPVPIGPNGTGLVRFRAPTKPGPASWMAALRLNQNGRDTTFVVRVPYRVAHRYPLPMLLFNGELLDPATFALPLPNRGLAFGDGFFETLIFAAGHLRLAADHATRMQQTAAALYLTLPAALATTEALAATLAGLATANQLPAARLRLQVWRGGGGRYTPPTAAAEWLATAEAFAPDNMPLQRVDFARNTQSIFSPLSFCKGPQAWLYVRAAHERQQRGLDEILLCDAAGHVAEAGAAAIFWVKDDVLFTPALASGCVAGVRRAAVLRTARAAGLACQEGLFHPADLLAADAVFTANVAAVRVVRRVGAQAFSDLPAPWLALLSTL